MTNSLRLLSLHTMFGELYRRWVAGYIRRRPTPITPPMDSGCTPAAGLVPSHWSAVSLKTHQSGYESEAQLVREFVQAIQSELAPIRAVQVGEEFNYNDGRTDVISMTVDGELVAFEAKLTHWKVALHQAYRATSFADRAYVVMPSSVARRVLAHRHEFDRRRVGLCAMQPDGTMTVLHEAPKVVPYMPWMSARAAEYLRSQI